MNPLADARCALRWATRTGAQITAEATFPPELDVFTGHFPGHPLVPGVAIIALIQAAYEEACSTSIRIVEVERCKWKTPTVPGERLSVMITALDSAAGDERRPQRITATISNTTGVAFAAHLVIDLPHKGDNPGSAGDSPALYDHGGLIRT